jgi:succinate dehydrogenase / fumarate reductase, cytochrome b subunit
MAGSGWTDKRPMSPHLQVWRWHVTMATSIFHRASAVALYVGSLVLVGWLVAAASGPEAYAGYEGFLLSPFGLALLFAFTAAITYHFANGLRHLLWDMGKGLDVKDASASGWFVIGFAAVATLAIWIAAFLA